MSEPEPNYYPSREAMPPEALERLETLAYEWGETYDAYLVIEGDREYYWLPNWEGVVAFTRRKKKRNVFIVGGALAPPERRSELLSNFIAFAKKKRWNLAFYNVSRDESKIYRELGCEITKVGEEPIIDLTKTEWRGKPYEWLRRQENYCKRQDVTCEEVKDTDPGFETSIGPELIELSNIHLEGTVHRRELQFFVGTFAPDHLGNRRLFVSRQNGKIVAFVVCNPCLKGEMWAVEIYRKLPDAPRGIIPYTIMQALRQLKSEGVQYASLSLIPCLRCDGEFTKGSRYFLWAANFWWKRMNWLFDMQGIYHFKSRFRPDYREMYIAAYPKVTISSMIAMGMTWEVLIFNPFRLLRRRSKKKKDSKKQRSTLATPAWRPERVVRALRLGGRKKKEESSPGADSKDTPSKAPTDATPADVAPADVSPADAAGPKESADRSQKNHTGHEGGADQQTVRAKGKPAADDKSGQPENKTSQTK